MHKKKIFIIAPDYYGVDKSIEDAFGSSGFDTCLKNTRKKATLAEIVSSKIIKETPFTKNIFKQVLRHCLNRENKEYLALIEKVKPDIVFVIKGETVFPETLKCIKNKLKIPCVAYVWDCPFYSYMGQFTVDDYRKNNFANGMHLYDHIFVYDPFYVEEIKKRGYSGVSYLPLAVDPDKYKRVHAAGEERHKYDFDISFVGAPYPERIETLDTLSEFRLGVFGDGWEKWYRSKKIPSYYKGKASGQTIPKIYSCSKIVLNIHDPEAKMSVNTRTFDVLACGTFELVDYKNELENLFELGREIVCYRSVDELKDLIRFYLRNDGERQAIAEMGKKRVLSCHTWRHRVKEAIGVLGDAGIMN